MAHEQNHSQLRRKSWKLSKQKTLLDTLPFHDTFYGPQTTISKVAQSVKLINEKIWKKEKIKFNLNKFRIHRANIKT